MRTSIRCARRVRAVLWVLPAMGLLLGADARPVSKSKPTEPAAAAEKIELFAAMKSGQLDVKLIPKNDRESRVMVKNLTRNR